MSIATASGTQHYRASLGNISGGVASLGHMINFDPSGPFTAGVMKKQTPAAFGTGSGQVTGNYAFGVSSLQNSASCNNSVCGGSFGAVGVFKLSAGNVTGGEVDFNANGQLDGNSANTSWPASPVPINGTGGVYSVSSTTGRGLLKFTPSGASNSVNAVFYVVSATDALVMDSDDQTLNSAFAGEMFQQSTSSFSANPLSGSYVGYDSGLGSSNTGRTDIYLIGPFSSGNNSLTGTQYRNDGGSSAFSTGSISGTYSVVSYGRMTITGGGSHSPIFYLVSSSQAFFLNSNGGVDTGFFQSQSGSPFSNSSVSGSYAFGIIDPQNSNSGDNSGIAVFASPNATVTEDNNGNGSQASGQTQSFTYSVNSTGLLSVPSSGSSCTISATSTTCQTLIYIISPTKAVIMDTQSTSPKITLGDK